MIQLETGSLSAGQLECLFGALPFEITFADGEGIVRYYNRPRDMVFTRSPDILGGSVIDCHPEKSRPAVKRVLDDLKSGRIDVAEFVKQVDGRVLHIRYIAARDAAGSYAGCLEVAQDITRIKMFEPGDA
ncbi:MAG: PAS domain-containing protein [bacterium]|jgi:DUF438 domain-containing protein